MSILFSGWYTAIVVAVVVVSWNYGKDFFKKKYVETWVERIVNGVRVLSDEPEYIGEYKEPKGPPEHDSEKGAYKLYFRTGTDNVIVYCPYTFQRLLTQCRYKRIAKVLYILEALRTEVRLIKPKKIELNYSKGWKAYFAFKACFNWKIGWFIGPTLLMIIFGFFNPTSVEFSLFGGLIGLLLCFFNSLFYHNGWIKPRKKKEIISTELWLYPIESDVGYIDRYEVSYDLEIPTEKADGTTEIIMEEHYNDPDDPTKPLILDGFEKIQDLRINTRVKNLTYEFIETITRERNLMEMKSNRRSYLARNAFLWNKIMTLQAHLARSTQKIRDLHEQISHEQATKHEEISESMETAYLQAESKMLTLKRMMERKFGAATVSKNFEKTMHDILEELQFVNIEKMMKKFQRIIDWSKDVAAKFGEEAERKGIDVELGELERIMKESGGDSENGGEGEEDK